jgi:hypothetical protein
MKPPVHTAEPHNGNYMKYDNSSATSLNLAGLINDSMLAPSRAAQLSNLIFSKASSGRLFSYFSKAVNSAWEGASRRHAKICVIELPHLVEATTSTKRTTVRLGRSRFTDADAIRNPISPSFENRCTLHQAVYQRYSSPQSPIRVIRSRDFASTASIMLRSSASSLTPNTRALSVRCCATPSRAPTITPVTAGRSNT